MTAGQRKPEGTMDIADERKAANLDQRLKSLIIPMRKRDTRSSHEYLNDLEEEYQARALLAKSKRFFKKDTQSSSASASKAATVKNKGLIAEAYEWDEEEVSSDDNEMVEVKVLMAQSEENDDVIKEGARNGEWVKISMRKHPLPLLKMLDGAEPISGPKTIKSILKSKSTFKAETLKGVIINESSSTPAKDNKSSSASKVNSAPAGKLKSVKIKDDPPLAIDFEAKYNKVKAKLALLSSSASASKAASVKNQSLVAEAYKWDEEEVSSDDNEIVEVKVLMALAEENDAFSKKRRQKWKIGKDLHEKV
ncbi:hypothetical protein Tco_0493301 [Tanacetum coccineum]